MRKFLKQLKDERGLTLVELLAVVVILAIVGTIAFVLVGNIIENSKKDAHIANAQQIIHAAKLYEASGEEIGSGDADDPGVTTDDQLKDFIDDLINPWTKSSVDYKGTVTKNEHGVYHVELSSGGNGCDINHTEQDLLSGDRKEICKGEAGGGGGGEEGGE